MRVILDHRGETMVVQGEDGHSSHEFHASAFSCSKIPRHRGRKTDRLRWIDSFGKPLWFRTTDVNHIFLDP